MPVAADPSARHSHWMLQEIAEQPKALKATLSRYLNGDEFVSEDREALHSWLGDAIQYGVVIAASGSSRHAGLCAEIMFEELTSVSVSVRYSSEFCHWLDSARPKAACIVISQSGETADTLAALRAAKAAGMTTLAITNIVTSTMALEADVSFPTAAGTELAIPATKSFTTQLINLYLLALLSAELNGTMMASKIQRSLRQLHMLPASLEAQLSYWTEAMRNISKTCSNVKSMLFVGGGIHYPIAREGALKLKECAYLQADGYPSGELKHGPKALLDRDTPLVALATVDRADAKSMRRYRKTLQLMADMKAEKAWVICLANTGDREAAGLAQVVVEVEEAGDVLLAISEVIPLQLLSYFTAVDRGLDVDRPRNLTKAVLEG